MEEEEEEEEEWLCFSAIARRTSNTTHSSKAILHNRLLLLILPLYGAQAARYLQDLVIREATTRLTLMAAVKKGKLASATVSCLPRIWDDGVRGLTSTETRWARQDLCQDQPLTFRWPSRLQQDSSCGFVLTISVEPFG